MTDGPATPTSPTHSEAAAAAVAEPPKRPSLISRLRGRTGAPKDPTPKAPRRISNLLNPIALAAAIPGPIFQKEVWISGRKAGTYWGRALYAAGMLAFVTLTFVNVIAFQYVSSPSQRLQQMQTVAPAVFITIMTFQLVALALAGCIIGAPAICEEKRAGTLGTLLTTPLKAWQIVVGKTAAFFVQILILTLLATPLMLAIRVFGGLTAQVVVACMALSLSTALLAGLLGLLHSIGAKRSTNAILSALVSLIASQSILPLAVLVRGWMGAGYAWNAIFFACSPAAFVLQVQSQFNGGFVSEQVVTWSWIGSTLYNLVLSALALMVASWRLRRVMAREAEGGSPIPAGKKSKRRGTPAPPAEPEPAEAPEQPTPGTPTLKRKKKRQIVHHGASRTVSDHPVLWRELRQAAFRTRKQLVSAAVILVAALFVLYWKVGMSDDGTHYTVAIVATLASLCIAAVSTTGGITGERESRTWEALLTTPLSARQIVTGKFLGALRRQWFVPALLVFHFVLATLYYTFKHQGFDVVALPAVLLIYSGPLVALAGTGVLFSVLCRKSTVAAVLNFALALGVWLVLPIVVGMLSEVAGRGDGPMDVVGLINPLPMIVNAVGGGVDDRFRLFHWNSIGGIAFTLVALGFFVFYALAGLLAVRIAAIRLAARSGRRK